MTKDFSTRQPRIIDEEQMRKYAVLVPIINTPEGLCLLFEKRSHKLNTQPGEICFPGGKLEQGESLEECAVRETIEELELHREQIRVLGPGDRYISPFNLMISPFLGNIYDYKNTFNTDEVAEVIKIPLNFFFTTEPRTFNNKLKSHPPEDFPYEWIPNGKNYSWAKGTYEILFYQYGETIVWGITARIVKSIVDLIKEYEIVDGMLNQEEQVMNRSLFSR